MAEPPEGLLTPVQEFSSALTDVLRGAPEMRGAPGLATAVARHGGNVVENAQAVMGVAKARAMEQAIHRVRNGVGPDAIATGPHEYAHGRVPTEIPGVTGTGGLGGIAAGLGGLAGEVAKVPGEAKRYFTPAIAPQGASQFGAQALTGTAPSTGAAVGGAVGAATGARAPAGPAPGVATVEAGVAPGVQQALAPALNALSPNQVFQTPSHIYRYLYDVRARRGNAAMVEAMLPLLGGMALGYAATHSAGGADAAGGAALDAFGLAPDTTGPVSAEEAGSIASSVPSSAAAGNRAMNATAKVLNVPATAVGATVRAASAGVSSPALAGGELATSVSGHVVYPDSWQRTMNATTWKLPGGQIGPTFGRLVAGDLGLSPGSEWYNRVSGALDALMYLAVPDAAGAAGRVYGKAKGAEGVGGFLGHVAPTLAARTPEQVAAAFARSPAVREAADRMAASTTGQIIAQFPAYSVLAGRLGAATTRDQVEQVFADAAASEEILTTPLLPSLHVYGKARIAASGVSRLGTPAPDIYDAELGRFVGRQIPLNTPQAASAVYFALVASGEDRRVAQDVATVLQQSHNPATSAMAARNAFKKLAARKMIAALPDSVPEDVAAQAVDKINESIDELMGGWGPGHAGQYGNAPTGADLSYVTTDANDPNAQDLAAAIWFYQADKVALPNTREIKQLALDIANMASPTGRRRLAAAGLTFESWLDHSVNERIFQPLALATGGWATRVSLSEVGQNVLRQGPLNFTAAGIAARAAKQGFKINTVEMPHFVAALRGALAGVELSAVKALGKDRILDAAIMSIKMNDGHLIPGAVSATHTPMFRGTDMPSIMENDVRSRNRRVGIGPKYTVKPTPVADTYTQLTPGNTGYFRSWSEYAGGIAHDAFGQTVASAYADALDRGEGEAQATQSAIAAAKDYLDALPEGQIAHMARHFARSHQGVAAGWEPHEDWAIQAVSALKGTVYGQGGNLHRDLLDDIVNKTVPDTKGMLERYNGRPATQLPRSVPGRELNMRPIDLIPQLTNKLHTKLLGPIVNTLSREPTYLVDLATERKLLETKVASGEMSQLQADIVAETRALHKTIRFVHNPVDRLKIENMLHVFAPFYFAQNQMIRRLGRLFAQNPGAAEQYVKAGLALNTEAARITAQNGLPTVIVPGTTLGGEGMTQVMHYAGLNPVGAIPIGLTGSVDISTTLNPFSALGSGENAGPGGPVTALLKPSFGPIAAIPLKEVQAFFSGRAPKVSGAAATLLGPVGANESIWLQGIPNSLAQHFAEGAVGYLSEGKDSLTSSYVTTMLSVMQAMAQQGDYAKAISLEGTGYPNESAFKAHFIKQANNITAILWVGRTLVSFFSPVSVSLGEANLKWQNIAQTYINKAKGNVSVGLYNLTMAHPDLVPYEVFKSTAPNGYAFPEVQGAIDFINKNRGTVTKWPAASVFLLPANDAKGRFSDSAYQMELAMGLRRRDAPSDFFDQLYIGSGNAWYFDVLDPQIKAAIKADPSQSYQIYQKADQIAQAYGTATNPIWYDYWSGNETKNKRVQVIAQIGAMLADPTTPKSTQATHLSYLYNLYRQEQANYTSGALSHTAIKQEWAGAMSAFAQRYPDMKTAVQTVFLGAF